HVCLHVLRSRCAAPVHDRCGCRAHRCCGTGERHAAYQSRSRGFTVLYAIRARWIRAESAVRPADAAEAWASARRGRPDSCPSGAAARILLSAGTTNSALVFVRRAIGATMDQRPFGTSGLTVPVIGMGTWQTFDVRGERAERERREVVDAALRSGTNLFDTSPMYGESPRVRCIGW